MEEVDNDGNTPLYYAERQPSGIMANLFPPHLKKVSSFVITIAVISLYVHFYA